jgi:hypothetical protein
MIFFDHKNTCIGLQTDIKGQGYCMMIQKGIINFAVLATTIAANPKALYVNEVYF